MSQQFWPKYLAGRKVMLCPACQGDGINHARDNTSCCVLHWPGSRCDWHDCLTCHGAGLVPLEEEQS